MSDATVAGSGDATTSTAATTPGGAGSAPTGNRAVAYVQQVLANGTWLVGTLAATAGFVVTKLGFDQIGSGDYSDGRWFWLLVSVAALTGGVLFLLSGVVRTTLTSRTRLGWVLGKDAKDIRERIEDEMWLLPGATEDIHDIKADGHLAHGRALEKFSANYARLMVKQYEKAADLSDDDRYRITLVQQAHAAVMDTVVAERLEVGSTKAARESSLAPLWRRSGLPDSRS